MTLSTAQMRFWSPEVRELEPYVPGEQPKIQNLLKLNTNENPYPPSPKVVEAVQAVLTHQADALRLYPDPDATALKHAIAKQQNIDVSQVFVGNGSDEVLAHIFKETTWKHRNLASISQGGLVNNLNDGMIWGLFPMLLLSKGFSIAELAQIIAIYPSVWGLSQLFTGKLADKFPKKTLLFWGMLLQGFAILGFIWAQTFFAFASLSVVLGLGTAVVYPTFLAAIADNTHPSQRAQSIGVYRLWRDLGYAVGAILTGLFADFWSVNTAIFAIGSITVLSALVIQLRMRPVS